MPALLLEHPSHVVDDSTRRHFLFGVGGLGAALLAGCSDDEDTLLKSRTPGPSAPSTRTVDDAFGPTEIPVAPTKVVADSVSTYGHLMSLGVTPVATALPEGISADYISPDAGSMTNVVADDGWTVDLEEVLAMAPQLILAVGAEYNKENVDRYRAALPTYAYAEYYDSGTDEDVKKTVRGIAAAIGREQQAEAEIRRYEGRINVLRQKAADAGVNTRKLAVVRFDSAGFIGVRIDQTPNAIFTALGFARPDFPAATVDGYLELSEENLSVLDEADILLINTDDDVVVDNLTTLKSPLWERLEVVSSGNAHFVSAWNGGDLPQLHRILDDIEREVVDRAGTA
ncbi:ABC transporter substrate-binding protein [Sporichthya polymorpha]|uniref:ABC transporter substrate-binding protein n=1 Tax=Sporichthya polymorpha TaxID=35751 RepID=UPI0003743BB2|nr:ABC transporter substrate-binding protein [Sporichthya polymorpha]